MKKSLLFVLITVLVLTLCSCNKEDDKYSYVENETGITITTYLGTESDLTIPKKIDGKKVTSIGNTAFVAAPVKNITVPEGIEIQAHAFAACQTLESVTLPDSVTEIPDGCFSGSTNLVTINASGITKVGFEAFTGTKFIEGGADGFVTIGDGLLVAWNGVGNNVSVPDTVKDIGLAFSGNTNIKSIFLPDTITEIDDYAFKGCIALSDVSLPSTITSIGTAAFHQCYKLEAIDIPAGCQSIGDLAFWDCVSLESIAIPDSVTQIGNDVFLGTKDLVVTTPFESTAFTYAVEKGIAVE